MARFDIKDFIDLGNKSLPTATSWEAYAIVDGSLTLIDQSPMDTENIYTWHSPLPNGSGGYYADLDYISVRCKMHIGTPGDSWYVESEWLSNTDTVHDSAENTNQNQQVIEVTELDDTRTIYDSIVDNFN